VLRPKVGALVNSLYRSESLFENISLLPSAIHCIGEALGFVTPTTPRFPSRRTDFISADFRDCFRKRAFLIPRLMR
jgi:hypothetical protein